MPDFYIFVEEIRTIVYRKKVTVATKEDAHAHAAAEIADDKVTEDDNGWSNDSQSFEQYIREDLTEAQ